MRRIRMKDKQAVIELRDTSYSYRGGEPLLQSMTLQVVPGSFHFLTGPSGAGKSTLLKLMYAELQATGGSVKLFGQDPRVMDRNAVADVRTRIGVVHQDCQFLDHLSIADNVALPLMVQGNLWALTCMIYLHGLISAIECTHFHPNCRAGRGNAQHSRAQLLCHPMSF